MKYLGPTFTVPLGGDAFAEGWERIFGKKGVPGTPARAEWKSHPCPHCGADMTLLQDDPPVFECPEPGCHYRSA